MALLPDDMSDDLKAAIDELESAVAEMESRLEATCVERDGAKGRQVELEIENANLRRELARARESQATSPGDAREQQAATANILKAIAASPSEVQPVFDAIAESARRLCDGHTSTVTQLADNELLLRASASETEDGAEEMLASFPSPLASNGIHSRVTRSGVLAFRHDMESEPDLTPEMRETARARGYRSILVVPMLRDGAAIGTIGVTRREAGLFPDNFIELLRTFADQAVIAVENARLFNETQQALERQTATAEILKVIACSPSDVQPVFEAIAASAKRLLGGFTATVLHFRGDKLHLVAFTPTSPEADEGLQASFPQELADFPIFGMARDGATIQFPDTEADDVPAMNRDLGRLRGFRSVMFVPLMNRGQAVGILSVTRTAPGAFADHHVQLLQTFADQAVIAIENTRLFNETQEALERQTATADILKVIASSPSDTAPVFDVIASSTRRLLAGFSVAVFRLIDGKVHLAAFTPTNPAADEALRSDFPTPVEEFEAFQLARDGKPFPIHDTEEISNARLKEIARMNGFRSMLWVPMVNNAVTLGIISVTRASPGAFADHHVQLLQTFADQAVIAIENTRLFNETREALERQTATADILKVIASSPSDVQPVFDAIVRSANRLIGGFSTAAFRYRDGQIHLAAFTPGDPAGDAVLQSSFPAPLESFPPYQLTREGAAAELPDTEDEPAARDIARARGFRSMLFAPLMNKGEAVGIITVTRVAPGPFGEQHTRLLQMFADQAVIAVKNAGLFDEVQARTEDLSEALQQQTATADVLKVISRSAFDLESVLATLTESAARLCDADVAAVTRQHPDGDGYYHATRHNFPPEWDRLIEATRVYPGRGSLVGRVLLESGAVQIADVLADSEYAFPEQQKAGGYRTLLGVPLLRKGQPIGVLFLGRSAVRPFTDKQVELVQTFADQAVIAIENVRLFDEVQARTDELSESLQQQTAVGDVLKTISRTTFDLQPVLDTLVNTAAILCGADMAFIMRRDGEVYRAGAAVGYSKEYIDFLANHPLTVDRGTVTGRAVVEKRPVQILDCATDPEYTLHETTTLAGQRTTLGVPLLRENEPIGTIVLARSRVEPFTQKQIDLVATFADQAVIAIENVRLFDELRQRTGDLSESLTYQTGSANILRVIASSPTDVKPALKAIVESACELCEANDALVALRNGDDLLFQAQHGSIPVVWEKQPIDPLWPSGRAVIDRAAVHVHDLLGPEGEQFPRAREFSTTTGVRTILCVPLLREGESIGIIVLRRTEVRPFSDKQIVLLETFANQAVIAIGNVRLFEQVQERTRDLSKSLDDLRAAQDRLVQTEKLASLGQLTAGIAHEIKNPLNFVNNFAAVSAELTDELKHALMPADLAEKIRAEVEELTGLLKDNLAKVVQHGKRADSIIKNMLLHSREGSGEHRPSDINALIDESLNLAYHGARAEKSDFNVTLERDFDSEAGEVDVFPQEITRVFLNLVSNGFYAVTKRRKESEEPGFEPTLRAITKNLGNAVEIRIRDNGTGIPSEVKEKMFNPFFTTKPAGEGTGLGLSMSHDIIVKQHGGTIDVDTQQGHFTEFRIVLPRTSNLAEKSRG